MFRKGRKLTMRGLTDALMRREYVFLHNRPNHPGFIISMQFNTLAMLVRAGRIRKAIRTVKAA
jgi:hypothetical protein